MIFLIDYFVDEVADKYENMASGRTVTLIEDASSGTFLYQALKNKITNIKPVLCKGAKGQRFDIVALKTEQGELLFPGQYASWFKSFEDEFLTFPNSLFKDQCDALSQALNYGSENCSKFSSNTALVARPNTVCGIGRYNTNIEDHYRLNKVPHTTRRGYICCI